MIPCITRSRFKTAVGLRNFRNDIRMKCSQEVHKPVITSVHSTWTHAKEVPVRYIDKAYPHFLLAAPDSSVVTRLWHRRQQRLVSPRLIAAISSWQWTVNIHPYPVGTLQIRPPWRS
jgi:hypothetical protein